MNDQQVRKIIREEIRRLISSPSPFSPTTDDSGVSGGGTNEDGGGSGGSSFAEDGGGAAGGGFGDSGYSPIFMQIASNGSITYVFSGGLTVPENPSGSPPPGTPNISDSVAWQDSTSVIREWIQGSLNGSSHELDVFVNPDINDAAGFSLLAQVAGGSRTAEIFAVCADDSAPGTFRQVLILDSKAFSAFLAITNGPKPWSINFGTVTPNAGTGVNVSHGLGATPQIVSCFPISGNFNAWAPKSSWTSSIFTLTAPSGQTTGTAGWIAIG